MYNIKEIIDYYINYKENIKNEYEKNTKRNMAK